MVLLARVRDPGFRRGVCMVAFAPFDTAISWAATLAERTEIDRT